MPNASPSDLEGSSPLPRRGVAAFLATVLGVALLVSLKTPEAPALAGLLATPPAVVGQRALPGASLRPFGGEGGGARRGAPGPIATAAPPAVPTAGALAGDRTVDGPVVPNPYGLVEVRVTISGGRITDVTPLQLPVDRRLSAEISQYVAPILRDEALQAQSAQIDVISGATYTSNGYARSLQAALDQAPR